MLLFVEDHQILRTEQPYSAIHEKLHILQVPLEEAAFQVVWKLFLVSVNNKKLLTAHCYLLS